MNEDIMKAIEQVAAQTTNDQKRTEIEAAISEAVSAARNAVLSRLLNMSDTVGNWEAKEMLRETMSNNGRGQAYTLAIQTSEVLRILLRKELLGE